MSLQKGESVASNSEERPLVSFCMTSHNRAKYVREALQSILDQTYDSLEIVICDDCSTDGTDKIIEEMVDSYRKAGGRHPVVFKRNEKNLNILQNYQQCFRMGHGELLVTGSDDDVQMPDRVEKTVEAWVRGGKKAGVIMCGIRSIDENGRFLGVECPWGLVSALGATMAYVRSVVHGFPDLPPSSVSYEDHILSARALFFGPELRIDEPLLSYRRGAGVSTIRHFRTQRMRITNHAMESLEILEKDMEYARNVFSAERCEKVSALMDLRRKRFEPEHRLVCGKTMLERWRGYAAMKAGKSWNLGWRMRLFYYLPCVLPFHLGNAVSAVFGFYAKVRRLFNHRRRSV